MRKTYIIYFGFAFLLIFISSSCSSNDSVDKKENSLEEFVMNKYGSNYELLYNERDDYVICINEDEESQQVPNQPFEFFVYDVKKSEQIWEDFISFGDVGWNSKYIIKVTEYPGTIKKGEEDGPNTYLYDVTKREKIK